MNKLVTVVIPTYNRAEYIKKAIDSVLAQTYSDWEMIVVDDGDVRVEDVVSRYADSRITYIKNDPPKRGAAYSRNVGIRNSKTEYVAFLDDDDIWENEKLNKQLIRFRDTDPSVGFCFSAIRTKSEAGEEVSQVLDGINDLHELSLTQYKGFLTSTLIVKKEVFGNVGVFDENLPSHQEAELIIRITKKYKGLGINEPLVVMDLFEHEHIGGNIERRIQGRELLLKKHVDTYRQYPKKYARQYFQLALWYRSAHRFDDAKRVLVKTILLDPKLRYVYHYINLVIMSRVG